jgi:hypothetical protein
LRANFLLGVYRDEVLALHLTNSPICELMDAGFTSVQAECIVAIIAHELTIKQASIVLKRPTGAISEALARARRINHRIPKLRRGRPLSSFKPESQFGRKGISIEKLVA